MFAPAGLFVASSPTWFALVLALAVAFDNVVFVVIVACAAELWFVFVPVDLTLARWVVRVFVFVDTLAQTLLWAPLAVAPAILRVFVAIALVDKLFAHPGVCW